MSLNNDFWWHGMLSLGSICIDNYLTIVSREDGLQVRFDNYAVSGGLVEYCINGVRDWKVLNSGEYTESVGVGEYISFRSNLIPIEYDGIGVFYINKKCDLTGNCNSLLFKDDAYCNNSLSGKSYAFYHLFDSCNIVSISEKFLPATTLADSCYSYMFNGCTELTSVPALPATTLAESCYSYMFSGCTGLTSVPALQATTLANSCYRGMFSGCTGLTSVPALPATTLADGCYSYMFSGCTGLTTPPTLPVTTLANSCYSYMFNSCTGLTSVPVLPATTLASGCYSNMFRGCTSLTKCVDLSSVTTLADSCFDSMFKSCTSLTTTTTLPLKTLKNYCYQSMFEGCTKITTPPTLPATTLAPHCYRSMFSSCTGLTSVPILPATTLATYCYYGMFEGCTKITTPPNLPVMTLANYCYCAMFKGCTSLTVAPELPSTTLATYCYRYMFNGCTGLTKAPNLPATTLQQYCYYGMFDGCTGLTAAPFLPATTLVRNCYTYMFRNCSNLKSIKAFFTTSPSTTYTNNWVSGVSDYGTFFMSRDASWNVYGVNGIPNGWKVLVLGLDELPNIGGLHTVNLNNAWRESATVDGLPSDWIQSALVGDEITYESYSNWNKNGQGATMYINIEGYTNFKFYIRSSSEINYDYVMVSQLDREITNSTSYNDSNVYAHTRGVAVGNLMSDYTEVEFADIPEGVHTITVVYKKDGSTHQNDDRGYLIIPNNSSQILNN
jgi:hypothetical protein